MNRDFISRLIVLGLTLVGVSFESRTFAWGSPGTRGSRLGPDDRAELLRYANDTWRSFERLTQPSGLPADSLPRDGVGWGNPSRLTTPTDIAAYLWSVLAAERLKLIGPEECRSRLHRTLSTLASMERHNGFYLNDLDPRTGATLKISPFDSSPRRPLVSSLDNAWLATALVMVSNVEPTLRPQATKLLEAMNFRFFYDPYNSLDPIKHPGQLHVGYWSDDRSFYGHYGMLNSEARMASYLGIARRQLPPEHYFRLYRTLPESLGPQEQKPHGQTREYLGVKVYEGSYSYRGRRIVPSWGGSMFEALMVTLFVPESIWGPRSWGVNHPLYVRAQIEHGLEEAHYGFWGFSPAASPNGGYDVYGVKALGSSPMGYLSYEIGGPINHSLPQNPGGRYNHGIVTPHASFLALRYAPREALANLRALTIRFPIYSQFGFHDSVDVSAGVVTGCILAIDQGMILAAIANELADDAMQHAFSDGPIEESIRPLLAMEEFSSGPIGPIASGRTTLRILDDLKTRSK
jgi:Putative glucoamylase/Protein of unknown function (DUF3131)